MEETEAVDPNDMAAVNKARADKLRPYMGRWVLLDVDQVVLDKPTLVELLRAVRADPALRGVCLYVPRDPGVDVPAEDS